MNPDSRLLEALRNSFNEIVRAPKEIPYSEMRALSAKQVQQAFSSVRVEIKGSENLPSEQGVIFIYNHLRNHPFFTVAEDFQITLDSHFISSSILEKYYKNPGTRVVRYSLPDEENHRNYYDKFGYIRVYANNFIPKELTKKEIKKANKQFYLQAAAALENNINLVFSPEGASYYTDESPGPFLKGIFKLASSLKQQPLLVPIVLVNFDKLPSKAPYKCQILPPFRMRDFGVTSPESDLLNNAVQKINDTFKIGVKELSREDQNFEGEIAVLKKNRAKKKSKKELLVFYGSSTLRLWKNVAQDFPRWDTLNLGFGGAFIHSLNDYFEELFRDVQPKVIVLYLGGNDLTLGFTASKIVAEIVSFIDRVQAQFPNTKILNISIKPSFERQHELKKIKEINAQLGEKIETLHNVYQVDFYESLLKNKRINEVYFLQDGLHLSAEGYQVLRKAIDEKLDHLI